MHKAWNAEHQRISNAADKSKDALDDFIEEQKDSSDHCSARLMEAKRSLDGLFHDLSTISKEARSHEVILETETENLKVTHLSIEAVNTQFRENSDECHKEYKEALEEVDQYKAELEELNQIAKPEVDYEDGVEKLTKSGRFEDALDEAVEAALREAGNELEPKTAEPLDSPIKINEPVEAPKISVPEVDLLPSKDRIPGAEDPVDVSVAPISNPPKAIPNVEGE